MRLNNWENNLLKTFSEWQSKSFVWGVSDCCWFASACVKAIRGDDPVKDFIKDTFQYQNEEDARKVMGRFKDNITGCIESRLGKSKKPLLAQRGDVVLLKLPDQTEVTGVVDLSGKYIKALKKSGGLTSMPLRFGTKAWTI